MKYFSTNHRSAAATLKQAVLHSLPADNGLYFPEKTPELSPTFLKNIKSKSLVEISREIATAFLKEDLTGEQIDRITALAINFPAPLIKLKNNTYVLELYHGPTLAFKDFGARFMAQLMTELIKCQKKCLTVLVATSGDTGSAVASAFLGLKQTRVVILYPSGKISKLQEAQMTTLGQNIIALEVDGTFDDCQKLAKLSFLDAELTQKLFLTSANSINIARLIPQTFYYFAAASQLPDDRPAIFSVPCGNFGNLTAGLFAKKMGLAVKKFIAATNLNSVVPEFLSSGEFKPRTSIATISNAMDVGNPSNFARMQELFSSKLENYQNQISAYSFSDQQTEKAISAIYNEAGYILDPHGAIAYLGLNAFCENAPDSAAGVFLATADPAKFKETVESVLNLKLKIPENLKLAAEKKKISIAIPSDFKALKALLLNLQD